MKQCLRHILIAFTLVLLLAPSCKKDGARVIPRRTMSKIYAEMLVTDQWIQNTPTLRRIADTTLVYEPILEKYGYTSDDYQLSVDKYMDDPERFSRILRTTSEILNGQIKALRKKQHEMSLIAKRKKKINDVLLPEFKNFQNYVKDYKSLDWADTVRIELDSVVFVHNIRRIPYTDTVYEGVKMIVAADTLALRDSLTVKDSVVTIKALKK